MVVQETKTEKEAAIKAIDDTRAAYIEHMKLKAPVQYWSEKAKEHKDSAWWRALSLIVYAAFGSIALAVIYALLLFKAEDLATKDKGAALIVVTAAAAIATTIVFCIGRLLQRLYLSERHMAIDAGLRSTLVECYLALTAEGKIDKDERPLVLPPLFRAGSDGIVNDDTNLDDVASLAARYLEKIKVTGI